MPPDQAVRPVAWAHSRSAAQAHRASRRRNTSAAAATSAGSVRTTPRVSQRRPDVVTRARSETGREMRLRVRANVMSSIRAIAGKPPAAVEGLARDEHRLIAGGDAGEARARVHRGGDDGAAADAGLRSSRRSGPRRGRVRASAVEDDAVRVGRKPRVGVEEQQHVAARDGGAGIHLRGAPACARDDAVGERRGAAQRSRRGCRRRRRRFRRRVRAAVRAPAAPRRWSRPRPAPE